MGNAGIFSDCPPPADMQEGILDEHGWSLSKLTVERPDIWLRALELASGTTGMFYEDKRPLKDGTIFACGYYGPTNREWKREQERKREQEKTPPSPEEKPLRDRINEKIDELERARKDPDRIRGELEDLIRQLSPVHGVYVPSGAMEWLLHEVGHWVIASDLERRLPNYGGADYELEAWAFQDAVLSHLGTSREFTPPSYRGGPAFETTGPVPKLAIRKVEKNLARDGIDLEPFQRLWEEWVAWGQAQGDGAPWRRWH